MQVRRIAIQNLPALVERLQDTDNCMRREKLPSQKIQSMKLRHLPELLIIPLSPVGLTTIALFCGLYFFWTPTITVLVVASLCNEG